MSQEKILLKDELFHTQKIINLSTSIWNVYPNFDRDGFVRETCAFFPDLELKQRIYHIKDMFCKYLPDDFNQAVQILIQSLPAELDLQKTDNDFGDFIYAPYGEYIVEKGCCREFLDFSLQTLETFTKRFSMEFSIRPFLKKYPQETMKYIKKWSKDENYHVRRLASEGIRPNLPWGGKIDLCIESILKVLDNLYTDPTQYVLRSVANNLNDITKIDAEAVINRLLLWKKSSKQSEKNMQFLIQHSLRTQIKEGNPKALQLLGYYMPDIKIENFRIITKKVNLGESLEFRFHIQSNISQKLLINYKLFFVGAYGRGNEKVFHISKKSLTKGENIIISKKHPLKTMTTKKLYSGIHSVELVVNGEAFGKKEFELVI